MSTFQNVFAALDARSEQCPDRLVYSFANERGQIEDTLTWKQLLDETDALTGFLRTHCALPLGSRVLLVYPPSLDFVVAFAACLRAGIIPAPVYPPSRARASDMDAFAAIAASSGARLVLTNEKLLRGRTPSEGELPWIRTDDVQIGQYEAVHAPAPEPEDLALLQYTSGSTSSPKGVMITHGNLSHQLEYTRTAMNLRDGCKGVFWVPQYHDLGLIGGILNALGGNLEMVLLSPLSFIKRPAIWFELMHEHRATHTAAPNFAFELALRMTTAEQRASWDLSCLEMVMSAAEPVRASTTERFLDAFRASKLPREAYLPAYGLAEHTVAVTFKGGVIRHFDRRALEVDRKVVAARESSEHTTSLVSSGSWSNDVEVRIVDPDTSLACAPGSVGEVWVDSPSKARGYWQRSEINERSFEAVLHGDEQHRYLRTGDLGFVHDGQLHICGRLKDMLIVAGRNVYPQDVEDSVEGVGEPMRASGAAAFAVDVADGEVVEEKLVLLAEVRKRRLDRSELERLALTLSRVVLRDHQLACHAIVLAGPGTVLKTTSGKIRRQACRARWSSGQLEAEALYVLRLGQSDPSDASDPPRASTEVGAKADASREGVLRQVAARVLNLPRAELVDLDRPLTEQGMGSLVAVDFCHEVERATGQALPIAEFFNFPSIAELDRVMGGAHASRPAPLDALLDAEPNNAVRDLVRARTSLLRDRFTHEGFRIGEWHVRPARLADVAEIQRLDQQEYGWLGDGATDAAEFIEGQVRTLNRAGTPWVWVLERASSDAAERSELVGWYIMQPTHKLPRDIRSWADATDDGLLTSTFDPQGKHLYLVAAGISREYTKQAHRLMVLNALSLMKEHGMTCVFACLAMPGFAETHAREGLGAEDYMNLTHENGAPRDAFLAFFRELWAGEHRPLRLLVDGYPPDRHSGGHGVCAAVDVGDPERAIEDVFEKLAQQRRALFAEAAPREASADVPRHRRATDRRAEPTLRSVTNERAATL